MHTVIKMQKFIKYFLLQAKDLPTYKDNDFLEDGARISIGQEEKDKLLAKLDKDVEVSKQSPLPNILDTLEPKQTGK